MAFKLEEAYVELKTKGFADFEKQTAAISKNLSVVGKQIAPIQKLSVSFSQQSRHAQSLSASLSEIQTNFMKSTAEADRFFKKAAAGFRSLPPTRPSTFARQRQNAMRAGSVPNSYRFENLSKDAEETSRAFRGIFKNTGIEKLTAEIQKLSQQLSHINRDAKSLKTAFGGVASSRVQKQFAGINQSASGLNNNFKNVRYQTLHAGYALKHLQQPIKAVVQGFIDVGTSVAGGLGPIPLATSAASLGLVALTRVIGSAVSQSADLEKSLAEVATISPEVAAGMSKFADILGDLSVSTRTDVGLLSEGLYQAISSGISDVNDALSFVETSALAARAGLTRVDVAVDGLSSVINAFGMEASDARTIADKFFKTVEVGKLRFEDLASNIGKVAPIATALGVSLDELLAAGAALTTGGNTLSQSFTSLSGIMNAVLRPSQKAVTLSKELGIEFTVAALKAKGLTGFLRDLQMQTGGNEEVMAQLFGRVEGLKGILALTGAQADAFTSNLDAIGNSAGATDKAVGIMNDTLHGQIDLLKVQLANALRIVGSELLPDVTAAMKEFNAALMAVDWDSFRKNVQDTIRLFTAYLDAAGKAAKVTTALFDPRASATGKALGVTEALLGGDTPTPTTGDTSAGAFRAFEADTSPRNISATPTPATQPVPTATQAGRVIKLSDADQNALDTILNAASRPSALSPPPRGLSPIAEANLSVGGVGTRPFLAPTTQAALPRAVTTGTNIAPITSSPIPGVTGELINPATAIMMQDAAQVFSDALSPLEAFSAVGDTAAALRTPETLSAQRGRESLDALLQRDLDQQRGVPVAVPSAFGNVQQDFGFDPSAGPDVGKLLTENAERLAGSFTLIDSAIQGGASGGLPGALIAVGTELLSMTEGFGRIQESWNRVVGQMVAAIEPVISVIADALAPVFDALAEVVQAMEPYFKILGTVLKVTIVPAFKLLGTVIGLLAKGIQAVNNFIIKAINFVIRLINKIPFVDIAEIPTGDQRRRPPASVLDTERSREGEASRDNLTREPLGRLGDRADAAEQARASSSGGFRIQNITGATRDILVDALSPLRQLTTTFPAMLDELKRINVNLRDMMGTAVGGYMPRQPNLAAATGGGQADIGNGLQRNGIGGVGGQVVYNVRIENINVEQTTDLTPDELRRQIEESLDRARRAGGEVFPNNRNRNNAFI